MLPTLRSGFRENLTPYIRRPGAQPRKDWFPIGQVRTRYEGNYYGVPRSVGRIIAYNRTCSMRQAFPILRMDGPSQSTAIGEPFHRP